MRDKWWLAKLIVKAIVVGSALTFIVVANYYLTCNYAPRF